MRPSFILIAFALGAAMPALAQTAPAPPGAQACLGCHGAKDLALPSLDGLKAADIAAAMAAFRGGSRDATVMDRISKGFSEAETEAIAEWLAKGGAKP